MKLLTDVENVKGTKASQLQWENFKESALEIAKDPSFAHSHDSISNIQKAGDRDSPMSADYSAIRVVQNQHKAHVYDWHSCVKQRVSSSK